MRRAAYRVSLIALLCMMAQRGVVWGEICQGIGPLDKMADIKARLPGATYERIHPAWAQEEDALFGISGEGLSGTIIVKFFDTRPFFRRELGKDIDSNLRKTYEALASKPEEEAMSVEWVRWIPDAPIPLQRFVSKYGKPERSGFSDDDLQPYREWIGRGLAVMLSDDEKRVLRVDYRFTLEEQRHAYKSKYGFVPTYLK